MTAKSSHAACPNYGYKSASRRHGPKYKCMLDVMYQNLIKEAASVVWKPSAHISLLTRSLNEENEL